MYAGARAGEQALSIAVLELQQLSERIDVLIKAREQMASREGLAALRHVSAVVARLAAASPRFDRVEEALAHVRWLRRVETAVQACPTATACPWKEARALERILVAPSVPQDELAMAAAAYMVLSRRDPFASFDERTRSDDDDMDVE